MSPSYPSRPDLYADSILLLAILLFLVAGAVGIGDVTALEDIEAESDVEMPAPAVIFTPAPSPTGTGTPTPFATMPSPVVGPAAVDRTGAGASR